VGKQLGMELETEDALVGQDAPLYRMGLGKGSRPNHAGVPQFDPYEGQIQLGKKGIFSTNASTDIGTSSRRSFD